MLLREMRDKSIEISQGSFGSLCEALPSPRQGKLAAREPRLHFTLGGREGTATCRLIPMRFTSLE